MPFIKVPTLKKADIYFFKLGFFLKYISYIIFKFKLTSVHKKNHYHLYYIYNLNHAKEEANSYFTCCEILSRNATDINLLHARLHG
jgi:hypothetical protein